MTPDDETLTSVLLDAARQRGPDKTICPSEVARSLFPDSDKQWRAIMPRIRTAASELADRGWVRITRQGSEVPATGGGGPIRIGIRVDARPDDTPILDVINLGPACAADLRSIDIHHLGDLRHLGARKAFERTMMDRLLQDHRKNHFHSMYLYAIWGGLHRQNINDLTPAIREWLKRIAAEVKVEVLGSNQ